MKNDDFITKQTRCPTNFPSGPSFGATFDRGLIRQMANKVGVELRAMLVLGDNANESWAVIFY